MNKNFSRIAAPPMERSTFNRSRSRKTSFDAGELIPCYLDEVLPGDTMSLQATFLARLQSMWFPIMDNIFFDYFFFFVPKRLLWDNWEGFIAAQQATITTDPTEYIIPVLAADPSITFDAYETGDYFGLPTEVAILIDQTPISALPFRAFNLIYNEWFRDENLQNPLPFSTDDGPDNYGTDYSAVPKRGKRHDYFTSCLPWPQKGDAVMLPLGTQAPVIGSGKVIGLTDGTNNWGLNYNDNAGTNGALGVRTGNFGSNSGAAIGAGTVAGDMTLSLTTIAANSGMIADLSAATAATVNQLREAFAFQQILELDARGGTRYTEYLQATWHQRPEDYRLQRPEYLGGSSKAINVSAIPQTSGSPATVSLTPGETPQGNLAAHAQGSGQTGFHKSFVEHGYIIGICNVRADITYQQGIDRLWTRSTRFDFPHPALMHLGEQAVLNQEIFAQGTVADVAVFGYQERWAEYRTATSQVTGSFRSNAAQSLDAWHLSLNFPSLPTLNAAFIEDEPPLDRVISVTNEKQIFADMFFNVRHTRQMPAYSTPGLMGRF